MWEIPAKKRARRAGSLAQGLVLARVVGGAFVSDSIWPVVADDHLRCVVRVLVSPAGS